MKLYISGNEDKEYFSSFPIVDYFEMGQVILILPGGLECFYDLFRAIQEEKTVFLYNKNFYYTSLIKNLFELHEKGILEKVPAEYIQIESNKEELNRKLEEIKWKN